MNKIILTVMALALGFAVGKYWPQNENKGQDKEQAKTPLYWVAPMDDSYRQDQPGQSPMGMDLVPVFAKENNETDEGPGTVHIQPHVENNLGVKTAEVTFGNLNQHGVTQGVVRYAETEMHHLHAKTQGWLRELKVKSTDEWVEEGQLLYRIYATEWVNVQQELLFAIKQNSPNLIQAAEQRLIALQFPSEVIKQVKKQKQIIESVPFKAPQSGYLIELNVREGHVVKPTDTMMILADNKKMWLDTEWFAEEWFGGQLVQKGQKITAKSSFYPNQKWEGVIDYIYPSADAQNRTIKARIELNNDNGLLRSNMSLQVSISREPTSNSGSLLVPQQAVIQTANQNRVVLALGNGAYKSVAVKLGNSDGQFYQILGGLKAGDEVVTSAQFLLDSESSKSSDFARLGDSSWPYAEVNGTINSITDTSRMVNISRDAIIKWQRPAATLDFQLENTLDINQLNVGEKISFKFEIREGEFVITNFKKINQDSSTIQVNKND